MRTAPALTPRDLHTLPMVAGGASPETRADSDALRALSLSSTGVFTGCGNPSGDALERARVELGRLIQTAERLRASLPDRGGVRRGSPVHRILRAMDRWPGEPAPLSVLAARAELSLNEAGFAANRAVARGWLKRRWGAAEPSWEMTPSGSWMIFGETSREARNG